ncbi:PPS1 Dual specificity protein phosphatase PPS1 [Candida maltosa Xu316]|uniref:Uncharacterized protein n=1 Tax=Candida maltosa (strain Xu316) TaxID=1245528 RepID=M3JWG4_CANMX|nr:hypothetical protein G210_2401 [Candida maltosa Xu316]
MSTATTTKMPQIQTSSPNSLGSTSAEASPSPVSSPPSSTNQLHRPIPRRNTPIQIDEEEEEEKPKESTITDKSKLESPSALALPSLSLSVNDNTRSCKRSSSSSNDQIYERDRFRARLKSFNDPIKDKKSTIQAEEQCEVCEGISFKTTKLNIDTTPVDNLSTIYDNLPFYTSATNNIPMKVLNIDQLKEIFNWYFNSKLPITSEMFPWLHGLHKFNFSQKSFFLVQQQQLQQKMKENNYNSNSIHDPMNNEIFVDINLSRPENIRFLMCLSDETIPVNLHNTVKITEILTKIEVSKLEIKDIVKQIWSHYKPDEENEELIDLLVSDCVKLNVLPIFLNLDPERGISLRNFQIQVAKLSTCSDFIIYGTDQSKIDSIARIIWLAQKYEHQQRKIELEELGTDSKVDITDYHIFIFKDDLSKYYQVLESPVSTTALKAFTNISRIDTTPLNYKSNDQFLFNDYNLPLYEKIETTRMASATKIHQNVWAGNFWDHQIMLSYLMDEKDVTTNTDNLKDYYCTPANSIISQTGPIFDLLPPPKANWRLFIRCHGEASFPDLQDLSHLLFKYTISSHDESDDFHHLEFPPSGSIGIGDCKEENLQSIINTCKLIYLYSSSNSSSGLSSLIYCTDGYTESSLLVFCYLMYSLNISLDEAMLKLHLSYGRPFYIFNSDVVILRKLEPFLRKFSPEKKQIDWANLETLTGQEINELLLGPPRKIQDNVRLGFIANESDESDDGSVSSGDDDINSSSYDWVNEVDGSIPSKILPHLYLGSLKHASCLPLLNKLGIKKVISVGETLSWLNGYKFQRHNNINIETSNDGNIEMFHISPKNPHHHHHHHHHPHTTTIDTVMKVNNLEDDGIDELTHTLPEVLKFINEEYEKTNGDTKILVHCRVGVSRSATVVIAEVMKRLNINLPMAYLYVRVRRLNIIIQPHLRFMYELFKWEEREKLKRGKHDNKYPDNTIYLREIDWFIMCREITKLNTPYLNNNG